MSLFGNGRRFASQDKQAVKKATGKSNSKGEGHYFIKKKEEVEKNCFEQVYRRVQGDDSFSWAELPGKEEMFLPSVGVVKLYWSCQVVHLFLWRSVTD